MDVATLIREKNNEYLKLLRDGRDLENRMYDKLNKVIQEISQTQDYYETKIKAASNSTGEKIDAFTRRHKEELSRVTTNLKNQKVQYSKNEDNRQKNMQKKLAEKLSKLETERASEKQTAESAYKKQLEDINKKYHNNLNIINELSSIVSPENDEKISLFCVRKGFQLFRSACSCSRKTQKFTKRVAF